MRRGRPCGEMISGSRLVRGQVPEPSYKMGLFYLTRPLLLGSFYLTRPLLLGEVPHPLLNPPLLRR